MNIEICFETIEKIRNFVDETLGYIELCKTSVTTHCETLDDMNSKYLDKSVDDLDIMKKELQQLYEAVESISIDLEVLQLEYELLDAAQKL